MKTIFIAAMLAALSMPALAYTCTHDVGPDNGNKVTCEQAQADLRTV